MIPSMYRRYTVFWNGVIKTVSTTNGAVGAARMVFQLPKVSWREEKEPYPYASVTIINENISVCEWKL